MFTEGDIECIEQLLKPAKRVIKVGRPIIHEPFQKRMDRWHQIKSNYDLYLDEQCGTFLKDLDNHFRAQFDAALLILSGCFLKNQEGFREAEIFSRQELETYTVIDEYNLFDILSIPDLKQRLLSNNEEITRFLEEFNVAMNSWMNEMLKDGSIRPSLKIYYKKRWDTYNRKVNAAISEATLEYNWVGNLINNWKNASPQTIIQIRDSVLTRCSVTAGTEGGPSTTEVYGSVVTRSEIGTPSGGNNGGEPTTGSTHTPDNGDFNSRVFDGDNGETDIPTTHLLQKFHPDSTLPENPDNPDNPDNGNGKQKQVSGGLRCPSCDTECQKHAKFCYNCGKKLPNQCSECGNVNEESAKFCDNCGNKLKIV